MNIKPFTRRPSDGNQYSVIMTGQDYSVFEELKVSKEQVIGCSYSNWYPKFKLYVAKSIVIKPLTDEFIEYLSSESIRLPQEKRDEIVADSDNEYSDWSDDEEGPQINPTDKFSALHQEIKDGVRQLGGKVSPKLNWSAPKDAKWIMANNTTKCEDVSDVYLLLNASDHIAHDIDGAFNECGESEKHTRIPYELVLRQWVEMNPALEFRVFIKNRTIVGVSQRDLNYYDYLEKLVPKFRQKIDEMFTEVIEPNLEQDSVIVDLYIPRPFDKVWIVDFNPFSRKTDSLLFTWHELIQTNPKEIYQYELRLISETNLGRFSKKEHSENQVPIDVIDASVNTDTMIELAKKWLDLQEKGK